MIPIVTAEQMRSAESAYVDAGGNLDNLMQRAGMEIASRVPGGRRSVLLAGPGNNGGDALAAARILVERGDDVFVYTYKRSDRDSLPGIQMEEDPNLDELRHRLALANVVIDGLLGIGRQRTIEGALAEIISVCNAAPGVERIAIDLPTGIDVDTGAVESVAFRAHRTITLGAGKRGLWGTPGADFAGTVEVADIGLDARAADSECSLTTSDEVGALLPRRSLDWNKGKSGSLLVVSGSNSYCGAPVLASNAAYRAGAGLVELAVPERIKSTVASGNVEAIFADVDSDQWMSPASLRLLEPAINRSKAVAIGPGLGQHPETVDFVQSLLERLREADIPTVLDADGLNAVADWEGWWEHAPKCLVVTPHPGEMARLLHSDVKSVQADRFTTAAEAAKRWGIVVVLKGSNSIVALPSGRMCVNSTGGPNLGTAGTGDILTGVIAALLAQGMSPRDAAVAGAWIHGEAGDDLRRIMGDAGTTASDLWSVLPVVRKQLTEA